MSDVVVLGIRASGWLAALALVGALAATPFARLAPRVLRARRPLGILAALAALAHGASAVTLYVGDGWPSVVASVTWLRSGALALALLAPLLLTSFPSLVSRMRVRVWKPLHRLAYVAAALVVHHLALSPFAPRAWVIALAAGLALLLLGRWPRRAREAVAES